MSKPKPPTAAAIAEQQARLSETTRVHQRPSDGGGAVAPSGAPVVAPAQARRCGRPGAAAGGALALLAAATAAPLVVGIIFFLHDVIVALGAVIVVTAAVVTLRPFRGRSGGGGCRDRHQRRRRRLGRLIVDGGMIALLDGTLVAVRRATPRC